MNLYDIFKLYSLPTLQDIVYFGHIRYIERGGVNQCAQLLLFFLILSIYNLFNIMDYHLIIVSSYHNHIRSIAWYTLHHILRGNPSPGGKTTESFIIIIIQQQLEGGNNPLITMTSILQLKLEGGYNPLIYRLHPEGSSNSLVLQLQPEGGYNPLPLPHPAP